MSGRVTHRIRIRYGYLHQSRAENARRVYQHERQPFGYVNEADQ